jgi:glyoxylase I family protein
MPQVAGINHIALTVTDIERSMPWYCEVLGLAEFMRETHPDGIGKVIVLATPDFSTFVGLHTHPTNEHETFAEQRTGLDHVGFMVANRAELDAWSARLAELGVVHSSVNEREGYATLAFRDPDNIQLEFIAMG